MRTFLKLIVFVVIVAFGVTTSWCEGQQPAVTAKPSLPTGWSKLKTLTPQQQVEASKIHAKARQDIRELSFKIQILKDKEKEDLNKVLTDTNRQELLRLFGATDTQVEAAARKLGIDTK